MSSYLSIAPGIDRAMAENTSALPTAPQAVVAVRPGRVRVGLASLLRWAARKEAAAAARLERPTYTVAVAR